MGDLTANLSRSEFACNCGCGFDAVNIGLPEILQDVADHFSSLYDAPVQIRFTSGNRCHWYNTNLRIEYNTSNGQRGANTAVGSKHLFGMAVDFKIFIFANDAWNQVAPAEVATYLENKYPFKFGIGRYKTRTHFDNRTDGPARWGN